MKPTMELRVLLIGSWVLFLVWAVWGWTPIGVRLRVAAIAQEQGRVAIAAFEVRTEITQLAEALITLPLNAQHRAEFNACVVDAVVVDY